MRLNQGIFPSYNQNPVTFAAAVNRSLGTAQDTVFGDFDWTALDSGVPGVSTAIANNSVPGEAWYDTLARVLPSLAQTIIMTDAQRQFLDTNLELAKMGKPPISASQYGMGVSVGMDDATKNLIMMLGAGALGIAALAMMRKR